MNTENEILMTGTVSEDAASKNTEAHEAQTQTSEAAPSETAPAAETNPPETAPEAATAPPESAPAAETAPVESAPVAAEKPKAATESVPTSDKLTKDPESTATRSPSIADAPAAATASPLGDVPYNYVYIINNPLVSAQTELVQLPNGKNVEISNTMTAGDALIAAGIFLLISFQVLKFLLEASRRR